MIINDKFPLLSIDFMIKPAITIFMLLLNKDINNNTGVNPVLTVISKW